MGRRQEENELHFFQKDRTYSKCYCTSPNSATPYAPMGANFIQTTTVTQNRFPWDAFKAALGLDRTVAVLVSLVWVVV